MVQFERRSNKNISGGFLVRVPGLSTIATRWELVNKIKCKFNVKGKIAKSMYGKNKTMPIQKPTQCRVTMNGINKLETIKGLVYNIYFKTEKQVYSISAF